MKVSKNTAGWLKRVFPGSLYKRFALIIVLPVFLIQIATLSFFINRNWIQNSNKYVENTVQQIVFLTKLRSDARDAFDSLDGKFLKLTFTETDKPVQKKLKGEAINPLNMHIIRKVLRKNGIRNFSVQKREGEIFILIKVGKKNLEFKLNAGDFIFASNHVFIFFNILVSLAFLAIAWLFMKNQVAPIVRLSRAMHDFKETRRRRRIFPRGASEIKNAIEAFNVMSEELVNYIAEQNIALAGVSHDIKTYLTRMKLQIVLIKDQLIANGLNSDVDEMEKIITEFMEYAKTESYYYNNLQTVEIAFLMRQIAQKFPIEVEVRGDTDTTLSVDENAIKRCFLNIISNSAKFASKAVVTIKNSPNSAEIVVEDDGPGVKDSDLQFLTKPFYKSDKSRNMKFGGVGLGLAIAKNIISKHHGKLEFSAGEELSGLRVKITVPK